MCIGQDLKGLSRIRKKSNFFSYGPCLVLQLIAIQMNMAVLQYWTLLIAVGSRIVPDDALYYSIKFPIRSCAPKILGSRSDLLYGPVCTQPFFQAGVSQSSRCHFFFFLSVPPSPPPTCHVDEMKKAIYAQVQWVMFLCRLVCRYVNL